MNHIYTHHYGCCLCFTVRFDLFPFQKFICSTVRPTYLPYKELYGFDGCASFVADYLNYESLMVPNELVCAPSRPAQDIDGFHGTFTMGTGGHYITMLLGQYLHHMTLCPPVAVVKRCYGIHLLRGQFHHHYAVVL